MTEDTPAAFWRTRALDQLSEDEWESLCDGCGKCCLHKIEDEDTSELLYTRVACRLLDIARCRCTDYDRRFMQVPDCLAIRQHLDKVHWLPETCAYRVLAEGHDLPSWHPLRSGDPEAVHRHGISIRDFALREQDVECIEDHVVEEFR